MIDDDALNSLLKEKDPYLRDLLTTGICAFYTEGDPDSFYPHSFLSASGDPLYAIVRAYQWGNPKQRAILRRAVGGAATLGLPSNSWRKPSSLDWEQRLGLLSIVATLVSELACADAVPRLTEAVTAQITGWNDENIQRTAFAIVLKAVTDLAISGINHCSFDTHSANTVTRCLVRLIHAKYYEPAFAPRCAHALVVLDPKLYFEHYCELIGNQIHLLHRLDEEQKRHAHATAEIIVDRLPMELTKYAPQLRVTGAKACDKWLLEALDSENSKYLLFRNGRNSNELFLTPKAPRGHEVIDGVRIRLTNPHFYQIQLNSDIHAMLGAKLSAVKGFQQATAGIATMVRPHASGGLPN